MKKYGFIRLIVILGLAALACTLPYFGDIGNVRESATESVTEPITEEISESVTETTSDTVTETESEEEELSEPTATNTENTVSEGRQAYQAGGVELTLPSSFVLGDVAAFLSDILDNPNNLDKNVTEQIRRMIAGNQDDFVFFATEPGDSSSMQTSLLVIKNEMFAGMSLDMIELFIGFMIGDSFDSMDQDRLILGNRDTLRSITAYQDEDVITNQVFYLFKDSETLWTLIFITGNNQVMENLRIFDEAVDSFIVLSQE